MGLSCIPSYHDYQKAVPGDFDAAEVERAVAGTISAYGLFCKDDRVLVAASGGKDSTVLLAILVKLGYHVEALTIDAHIGCYTEENLKNLRAVCASLGVKLHEVEFRKEFGSSLCHIQAILKQKGYDYKSCHTCGVLRRYLLNKHAKAIRPSVLATGHNLDDEAQAVMMNVLRGSMALAARMGPKTGMADDDKFIPRVKPLYFVSEEDIINYAKHHAFPVHFGECPCSSDTYRREMKNLFLAMPDRERVKQNIVTSFMRMKPKLMECYAPESSVCACEICGEPTSNDICNVCSLRAKLTVEA